MPFDGKDFDLEIATAESLRPHAVVLDATRIAGGKVGFRNLAWHSFKVSREGLLAALPREWQTAIYQATGEVPRGVSEQVLIADKIEEVCGK